MTGPIPDGPDDVIAVDRPVRRFGRMPAPDAGSLRAPLGAVAADPAGARGVR